MRACALRLLAAVGFAALNAWIVACGDVLPVDADLSGDGGVADGAADAGEHIGTDSGADAAAVGAATCDDCERLVFVTSGVFDGNLGGVLGADEKCRLAAAASTLANVTAARFKAWISETGAPASRRLAHGRKPYRLVDGTSIANDWSDLIDGTLDAAIALDESGKNGGPDTYAWTGTTSTGELEPIDRCVDWTSSNGDGYCGSTEQTTERWTRHARRPCDAQMHLYCVEE